MKLTKQQQEGGKMNLKDIATKRAGEVCTLDGKPARILGRLKNFAIVAQIPSGIKATWCWDTVEKIMQEGGNFKS